MNHSRLQLLNKCKYKAAAFYSTPDLSKEPFLSAPDVAIHQACDGYTKKNMYNGHYNHLHTINLVRKSGAVRNFVKEHDIHSCVMETLIDNDIPFVLTGSIIFL